jgi:aryl-alcohol dehydrogenase-like predicted oxidoreductase
MLAKGAQAPTGERGAEGMKPVWIRSSSGEIPVSRVILGSTYFGDRISEEAAQAILSRYAALGGTTIDTARLYGDFAQSGRPGSEGAIGRWLRESGQRKRFTLITKGGHPIMGPAMTPRINPDCLRDDIERSLLMLGTTIDIYYLHRDDPTLPVSQIMPVLHEYVRSGDIQAIGASNWRQERISEANDFARENALTPFTSTQIQFSLAVMDRQILNKCFDSTVEGVHSGTFKEADNDLPLLAFTSLAWGFFGKLAAGQRPAHGDLLATPENLRRLEIVKAWSQRTGLAPNTIAIAYVLSHPRIQAAAIVGASKPDQLDELVAAADNPLPAAFFDEIECLGRS